MNIRMHALASIRSGMPAQITVQATTPGVQFLADDREFIEFANLGYSKQLGYYRLSDFSDEPNETTNENPETIHSHGDDPDEEPMFVWYDGAGYPHLLGTAAEAADLYQAIGAFLLRGELDPEVIDEYDERWGNSFSISEAVAEAIAYGIGDDPEQIANRIRVAAAAGRIKGARNSHGGAWSFSKRTFRGWLVRAKAEKRGRPRKGGA